MARVTESGLVAKIRQADPALQGPPTHYPQGRRHLHHEASEGRTYGAGMAGGDGGADFGRDAWRPDDVRADRRDEGIEPPRQTTSQFR
jgi:hypothetical protein